METVCEREGVWQATVVRAVGGDVTPVLAALEGMVWGRCI